MTRVAINGFGRIGRNFLRAYLERRPGYEIVVVNDLGDVKTMAHLLEFDSLLGRLTEEVNADASTITIGDRELRAFSIPDPADLPWRARLRHRRDLERLRHAPRRRSRPPD